jgi:hypothetical protein
MDFSQKNSVCLSSSSSSLSPFAYLAKEPLQLACEAYDTCVGNAVLVGGEKKKNPIARFQFYQILQHWGKGGVGEWVSGKRMILNFGMEELSSLSTNESLQEKIPNMIYLL